MGADRITVGVVSWYSTAFIADLFQSLQSTAASSELAFVVCDNTNGQDAELYETLGGVCEIIPFSPVVPQALIKDREKRGARAGGGSYAHSAGLNMLLTQINTEYALLADPDCLVLAKGWDLALKGALTDRHIAIGTPRHGRYFLGAQSFLSPVFVFFRAAAFHEIHADWTPGSARSSVYFDAEWEPYRLPLSVQVGDRLAHKLASSLARMVKRGLIKRSFYSTPLADWLRALFGRSFKDTGWRIGQQARAHGYAVRLLTPARTIRQLDARYAQIEPAIDLLSTFELFLWRGQPFVTHYGGYRQWKRGSSTADPTQHWRELAYAVANACDAAAMLISG
jgi:hypothetical protein